MIDEFDVEGITDVPRIKQDLIGKLQNEQIDAELQDGDNQRLTRAQNQEIKLKEELSGMVE